MVFFASSMIIKVVVFSLQSRSSVKLICCIAFGLHLVLVVYLNLLLLSSYNNLQNKHNLINNHLHNNFLDHLWTFESSGMFLNDCLLVDEKSFFHRSWYCNLLILLLEDNIAYNLFNQYLFSNDKTKILFTSWKLAQIKKSEYEFLSSIATFDWYLFQLIVRKLQLEYKFCIS